MDSVLIVAAAAVFALFAGAIVNRYWPLMQFRGTAACCIGIVASLSFPLLYNDGVLLTFGPYLKENGSMWMFRGTVVAVSLVLSLLFLVLFERNYWKLEERLKERAPVFAVERPGGPTAEQIADAVTKRLAAQTTPTSVPSKPPEKTAALLLQRPAKTLDERIAGRAVEIIPKLTALAAEGERIFMQIIGDEKQYKHLSEFQLRIEEWRSRVGNTYNTELPDSGAYTIVLPKTGDLGIGPIGYEVTRLARAIDGQKKLIDEIEKYVRRSLVAADAKASAVSKH